MRPTTLAVIVLGLGGCGQRADEPIIGGAEPPPPDAASAVDDGRAAVTCPVPDAALEGPDMSSPPSGFTMSYGTWETDADYNTSVYCASSQSVELKSTSPAAGKTELLGDPFVVSPGQILRVHGLARQADRTAGNNLYLQASWYDRDDALLSTSDAFAAGLLPAINTWYDVGSAVVAPASAAKARLRLGKVNGNGFTAYWNGATAEPMVPCAGASLVIIQNGIVPAGWRSINLDTAEWDYGGFVDLANDRLVIPASGVYTVSAIVALTAGGTWTSAQARLNYTGSMVGYSPGPILAAGPTNYLPASVTKPFERGDTVSLAVYPVGSANFSCPGVQLTIAEIRL